MCTTASPELTDQTGREKEKWGKRGEMAGARGRWRKTKETCPFCSPPTALRTWGHTSWWQLYAAPEEEWTKVKSTREQERQWAACPARGWPSCHHLWRGAPGSWKPSNTHYIPKNRHSAQGQHPLPQAPKSLHLKTIKQHHKMAATAQQPQEAIGQSQSSSPDEATAHHPTQLLNWSVGTRETQIDPAGVLCGVLPVCRSGDFLVASPTGPVLTCCTSLVIHVCWWSGFRSCWKPSFVAWLLHQSGSVVGPSFDFATFSHAWINPPLYRPYVLGIPSGTGVLWLCVWRAWTACSRKLPIDHPQPCDFEFPLWNILKRLFSSVLRLNTLLWVMIVLYLNSWKLGLLFILNMFKNIYVQKIWSD